MLVPGYCNFFELSGKEVIKYGDFEDLEQKIRAIFNGDEVVKRSLAAAEKYASRNSGAKIATRFIELFEEVIRRL